jgi:hypothetical protein
VNEGTKPELLFDVAALLITSAALRPAAGASVVPASASIVASAPFVATAQPPLSLAVSGATDVSATSTAVDPAAVTHPISLTTFAVSAQPKLAVTKITSVTGVSLLRELGGLPESQLAKYFSAHPSATTKLVSANLPAGEVSGWWSSLSSQSRKSLRDAQPYLVGNLNGIPTAARAAANKAWISKSTVTFQKQLTGINGRAEAQAAEHQLHMLTEVKQALRTPAHQPTRSLLSVDATGQGKAAIVIGNLSKADYVTYMVPGMFFTVDGQIDDWTADASRLYDQQVSWLNRLHNENPDQPVKTVAVVAWMGYQTPDLTNIGSLDLAYQGRDALAQTVEAMQSERAGNLPYTTIVAHSYGSTAALMALTDYDFSVNALVLVGCPGSAAQSVNDLHVKNHNVWVGAAAWDPVPNSGWFGSDPASPSYGAHKMAVNGTVDKVTGKTLAASVGHNDYFAAGTESVRNMALIAIDHAGLAVQH